MIFFGRGDIGAIGLLFLRSGFFTAVLFFVSIDNPLFAQNESVPVGHPVYDFLYEMKTAELLPEYSPYLLPLDKKSIALLLDSLRQRAGNSGDGTLEKYLYEFTAPGGTLFGAGETSVYAHLLSESPSAVYGYHDSLFHVSFGLAGYAHSYFRNEESLKGSTILAAGGARVLFQFRENLGAEFAVTNGANFGNRGAALLDPYVRHSFTFNNTGRDNFDFTKGYARFTTSLFTVYYGREKTVAGLSALEPAVLGNAHAPFDYALIRFRYKKISYDILHGWLVTERMMKRMEDNDVQFSRAPKQLAHGRLGIELHPRFRIGIGQSIIYGSRSFEAAYFNPFLFWESAQRSLNDIDNSFLNLDWEWAPAAGVLHTGTLILDDLEFSNLVNKGFGTVSNTSLLQAGISLARPLLPAGITLLTEVCVIRPFTFTHPGYRQALNYATNGVPLGVDAMPNSLTLLGEFRWRIRPSLNFTCTYRYYKHGMNRSDSTGAVILNSGGDLARSFDFSVPYVVPMFEGDVEEIHSITAHVRWYFSSNLNIGGFISMASRNFSGQKGEKSNGGFNVQYNWH